MKVIPVVILTVIVVALNTWLFSIVIRDYCKDKKARKDDGKVQDPQNVEKDNADELNKALKVAVISLAISTSTVLISFFSVELNSPVAKPLNGMLTEEHQNIELEFEQIGPLGKAYYSSDPHNNPADKGYGEKYNGQFKPKESGTIYLQSRLLNKKSQIVPYEYVTFEDSLRQYGRQKGVLEENSVIKPEDKSWLDNLNNHSVSQDYTPDYDNMPEDILCGWGDSAGGRASFTIDEINEGRLYDKIVFNSISDSIIGNEKNFVAARLDQEGLSYEEITWNANVIEVEPEQEYLIRIYCHNNSPRGMQSIAKDVKVSYMMPALSGRSISVFGLITSSNAEPSLYWDGVLMTCKEPFLIEYVPGSAEYSNNIFNDNNPCHLSDSILNDWVHLGYDTMDGNIPGCYQYSGVVTIKVRIVKAETKDND